ncbi:MAG: alginate export family protein [Nitrospirae bacterium]|nr:alginate export family protein [Candidatus Manganitrophaceae bacterium]
MKDLRSTWRHAAFFLFVCLFSNLVYAEEPVVELPSVTTAAKQINIGGQGRIRYQSFPAPPKNETDFFTNYRFRLNVDVTVIDGVSFFLQPQKVGVWGNGETGAGTDVALTSVQVNPATGSGTGTGDLTLHQGYLDFKQVGGAPLNIRLGRFEYIIGGHRLIGNFDWSQRARSFDGAQIGYAIPAAGTLSLFAFKLTGEVESGPLPTGDRDSDTHLFGAYFSTALVPRSQTELTFINDRRLPGLPDSKRFTAGVKIEQIPPLPPLAFISSLTGPIWRGEYYKQWGNRTGTQEIDAFMYALRLGYRFDLPTRPMVLVGWEVLSGDDSLTAGHYGAFDTLYATNHLYYGYMDYFLNIPADMQGKGLRDGFVRLHVTPWERGGLALDVHQFTLEKRIGGEKDLGTEIDLTFLAQVNKVTSVLIGYSKFFSEKGMELLGRIAPDKDPVWGYAMVNVIF